jgi:hypothetical protein
LLIIIRLKVKEIAHTMSTKAVHNSAVSVDIVHNATNITIFIISTTFFLYISFDKAYNLP